MTNERFGIYRIQPLKRRGPLINASSKAKHGFLASMIDRIGLNCVGCGLCEGVCPVHAVKVVENCLGFKPVVDKSICISCGLCLELCPTLEIVKSDDLSKVKIVSRGYSQIPELYLRGTSGGIVSSIIYYLFDKGIIDGALVAFYDDELNVYGDFITSKEEVIEHSGSYYQTNKQLLNMRKIHLYKSVAVVGLPCHVEALTKYATRFNLKNITVIISLFCTIGRTRTGFKNFLKHKFGVNLDAINVSNYLSRYGIERLGKVVVKTRKGVDYVYSYLELLDYLDFFYTPIGCFNCRKMFGLNADISVGDDWGMKINRKIALIVANTKKGASLLDEIKMSEFIMIDWNKPLPVLLRSQPNGTAIKVFRPIETKMLLVLIKHVGLVLIRLRFPRKIAKLIRRLTLSYIKRRAY